MSDASAFQLLDIQPLQANASLRQLACDAIKQAITKMNIYDQLEEIRLDERQLSRDLGVSRTPIREALSLLEHEGFLRSVPRGGIFIVRKNKKEILETIAIWSALEAMAARLACEKASDEEIAMLRGIAENRSHSDASGPEHARSSMGFHRAIMAMSKSGLMVEISENLFIHMRAVRSAALKQGDRAQRSLVEHMNIVEALEARDPQLSARRVEEHMMSLTAYIEEYGDFLDQHENKANARKTMAR